MSGSHSSSSYRQTKKATVLMLVVVSTFIGALCGFYFYGEGPWTWAGSNDSLAPGIVIVGNIANLFWNMIVIAIGAFSFGLFSSMAGFIYLMISDN